MTEAVLMEAKKDRLAQSQAGDWKVTLTVKAEDMPAELLSAPMGQRLALVISALKDDGEVKPGEVFGPSGYVRGSEPEKSAGHKAVTRAAILCDDKEFQHWIAGGGIRQGHELTAERAATLLRARLGIRSRRDLAVDPAALERFLSLEAEFKYRDSRR